MKAKCFTRFAIMAFLTLLTSCSSGDAESTEPETQPELPTLTTLEPTNITNQGATLKGKISASDYTTGQLQAGVCWSTTPSPTTQSGEYEFSNGPSGEGVFNVDVQYYFEHGVTYYIRAFVTNSYGEYSYGNEITLTRSLPVTTLAVHDILNSKATLRGTVDLAPTDYVSVGFIYGTSSNPNNNDGFASVQVSGTTDFEINVTGLQSNTTYYVRSMMAKPDGNGYIYGEQMQFKTVGYTGPAGGYVVYDKGESIDGWRYIEIWPETVSYNANYASGALWSQSGTFISGLSLDFGTGLSNSETIAANASGANCAAKVCLNYTKNGYNDWFLGSGEEMKLIFNVLKGMNIMLDSAWTSSQYNASQAYITNYSGGTWSLSNLNAKVNYYQVYPIRRYN